MCRSSFGLPDWCGGCVDTVANPSAEEKLSISWFTIIEKVIQVFITYPRTILPTNICARLNEEHMSMAPTVMIAVPTMIDLVRPSRSPIVKATMAPTKQPIS